METARPRAATFRHEGTPALFNCTSCESFGGDEGAEASGDWSHARKGGAKKSPTKRSSQNDHRFFAPLGMTFERTAIYMVQLNDELGCG
jgi:hypothetical protein